MKLIAPFGFYGAGNIGDEATLQGFARVNARVNGGGRVWLGSRNPAHTQRVEPSFRYFHASRFDLRRRWAWTIADGVVFPGGTPIVDVLGTWPFSELVPLIERAAAKKKPVAFIGTGTERLLHDDSRRLVSRVIAPHVSAWTVRCTRDRDRLIEYGVPETSVTATADLAWMLERADPEPGRVYMERLGVVKDGPLIGVNVNIESFARERQPDLLKHVAALLDELVNSRGARILFLCNEVRDGDTFDLAASRETMASMKYRDRATILPNEYWAPQFMMSLIGCCDYTISSRYHFCLFSALQGVPFLSIRRSDKVSDLCADLEWRHHVGLAEVSAPLLSATFSAIEQQRTALVENLPAACSRMRARSQQNAIALERLRSVS